ncbi:MAG: fibronectin type III domain-containing protein, partial [Actinomycetes bacterium]
MRIKKISQTLLATSALLAGGLPVLLSAAPASAATSIPNLPARWSSISSPGSGTTCALAANGTIWCWGKAEGTRGVTWDATKGDPAAGTAVGPKQVGTATNWVAVEVGAVHACAKNAVGELWCWGKNTNGQLGIGTSTDSQVPAKVKSNGKSWYSFSLSNAGTCGIQIGSLWCWGDNTNNWLLPDSAADSLISLPRVYAGPVAVTSSTEVQIGAVSALRNGTKIYVNTTSGFNELAAPQNAGWSTMSVRAIGPTTVMTPYFNPTFQVGICLTTTLGSAICYSRWDLGTPILVGRNSDWLSMSVRQDTPREPICGIRGNSSSQTISCFSIYGLASSGWSAPVYFGTGASCFDSTASNPNFTNSSSTSIISSREAWRSCRDYMDVNFRVKLWNGTIPDSQSMDFASPSGSGITQISGGFFQGSVTGQTDYNTWGRMHVITSDGQIYAMGDGKYGERQDGLDNGTVTDSWAAALVQNPAVTSTDGNSIPKSGGASVTLNGSFLVGVTALTVGGIPISSWTEGSDGTTLRFTSPASVSGGTVGVTVTTSAGTATLGNAFTYGDSPSAPAITGLSASDGAITVGWSSPSSPGSSAVTSYVVTVSPGGATCTWTVGPLNCTVSGLTNGTTYRATVRAFSAVGPGLSSSNSAAFVPYKAPSAPSIVSISPSDSQITVTWSAATNNGSAITRYDVEAQPGGNSCSTSGTGTSCTISPLANGTAYSISVYATNDAGGGEVSTSSTLITPRTLAGAPTNVSITPGDRQLGVSWRAPSSNGGSAVTSYKVTAQPGSVTCTAIAPSTSCNLLGLSNGSVYSITVATTNPAGDSASSSTVTGSPVTIPGKPTISATEPGSNSVLVRWRAPSATGGASVSSYSVVASPGGNSCTT